MAESILDFDAAILQYLDIMRDLEIHEAEVRELRSRRDLMLSHYPELGPIHGLKRRHQKDGWSMDPSGNSIRFNKRDKAPNSQDGQNAGK